MLDSYDLLDISSYYWFLTGDGLNPDANDSMSSISAASDYIGDWGDSHSQRCYMSIEDWGSEGYYVEIHWSSSASEDTQWNMMAQYNKSTGELEYSNGTSFDYVYIENGDVIEDLLYTNATGKFYFSDGYLHWQDDAEHVGDNCLFEKW